MTSKKYNPSDGAVGPATALSFANSILSTSVGLHFPRQLILGFLPYFLLVGVKRTLLKL